MKAKISLRLSLNKTFGILAVKQHRHNKCLYLKYLKTNSSERKRLNAINKTNTTFLSAQYGHGHVFRTVFAYYVRIVLKIKLIGVVGGYQG